MGRICPVDWLLTSRVAVAPADLTAGHYSQQDIISTIVQEYDIL